MIKLAPAEGKDASRSVGRGNGANSSYKTETFAHLTQALRLLLEQSPIIPAVRSPEFIKEAAQAQGKIVYFLCGDPEVLPDMAAQIADAGKTAIVNLDLVQGLSRDATAVAYLAHHGVMGIISTHPEPLRAARNMGLYSICRGC